MASSTGVSRFRKTGLIQTRSGKDTYGIMSGYDELKNISEENYRMYYVEAGYEGRCDLIAFQQYGDPHLEWVLVFANRVKNPFNWPKAGETIKLPNSSYVRRIL